MLLGNKGKLRNRSMAIVGSVADQTREARCCHPTKIAPRDQIAFDVVQRLKGFFIFGLITARSTCRLRG